MRSTFGNAIDQFYGSVTITYNGGAALGGAHNVAGAAGVAALSEYSANNGVLGTLSMAVGQSAAGVSQILARGVQQLQIGVNGGAQLTISSAGAFTFTDTTGTVWGAPTGGAKGTGSINVAGGLFINGVATSSAPQVVTLASGSSRTSNTTLAIDATLQIAVAAAGTYRVELSGPAITGMGNGGIQLMFGLSAANNVYPALASALMLCPDGSGGTLTAVTQACAISSTIIVGNTAFYSSTAYPSPPGLQMSGVVVLNAATTIGVYWAQAATNATSTTLNAGTTLTITKIA